MKGNYLKGQVGALKSGPTLINKLFSILDYLFQCRLHTYNGLEGCLSRTDIKKCYPISLKG